MARYRPLITAFILAFTALFLITSTQAHAKKAVATPEGTQKLQSIFEGLLDQYKDATEINGSILETEGKIMVEASDTYYAITLPHLAIRQEDGSRTEIGMIAINALPGSEKGQWKMTLALPTPIVHYDENNKPILTANIGRQSFAGVWHEKFKNFVKMNAQYEDINIDLHEEQARIVMPNVKIIYDLEENAEGRWNGPANFKVSDFQMHFDKEGGNASIAEITMNSMIRDYSIDAAIDYQEKISAILESYEGGGEPDTSAPHVLGLYNLVADFMGNAWDGFDFAMGMKDFSLTTPPIPGSPAGKIKVDNGIFGFNMNGFRSGAVNMGIKLAYDGFNLAPITKEYNEATPDHMNFDLRINNLPYKEITDLGRTSIQGAIKNPAAGKMVGLQAMMVLPQILTQAHTNIEIKDTSVGNETYNLLTNGTITANLNAMLGMTANAKTEIFGLDNLIAALNSASSNPDIDADKQENITSSLSMLAIIKMVGQMGKNAAGQDVRSYDFEVNEKGEALMNGTDLKMLMQAK